MIKHQIEQLLQTIEQWKFEKSNCRFLVDMTYYNCEKFRSRSVSSFGVIRGQNDPPLGTNVSESTLGF